MEHPSSWRDQALCRTVPTLPWIAEPAAITPEQLVVMEAVCGACAVCFECLEYAGCQNATAGFWAGTFRSEESLHGGDVA